MNDKLKIILLEVYLIITLVLFGTNANIGYAYQKSPISTGQCPNNAVEIANLNIKDTRWHKFYLSDFLPYEHPYLDIMDCSEFRIIIQDLHRVSNTGSIDIILATDPDNNPKTQNQLSIYSEYGKIKYGNSVILQAKPGGVGQSKFIKVVPSLKGLHSNLVVSLRYSEVPINGDVRVTIQAKK